MRASLVTPASGKDDLVRVGDPQRAAADVHRQRRRHAVDGRCVRDGDQRYSDPRATAVTYCGVMPNLTDLPLQAAAKIQESVTKYLERGSAELHYARKMFEAGAFKIEPPQNIAAMVADIRRWGEFGMIPALNARRNPQRDGGHRRRRRDDVQGARRRRQRRRQRIARDGRQGRRRGRAADPQPPLVPRRDLRGREGRARSSSCSTASSRARRSRRSPSARVRS